MPSKEPPFLPLFSDVPIWEARSPFLPSYYAGGREVRPSLILLALVRPPCVYIGSDTYCPYIFRNLLVPEKQAKRKGRGKGSPSAGTWSRVEHNIPPHLRPPGHEIDFSKIEWLSVWICLGQREENVAVLVFRRANRANPDAIHVCIVYILHKLPCRELISLSQKIESHSFSSFDILVHFLPSLFQRFFFLPFPPGACHPPSPSFLLLHPFPRRR